MKGLVTTIAIFLLVHNILVAQDLKLVKNQTLNYIEEYTVLAKDKRTMQGEYKKYIEDGSQSLSGKMENNVRVGEWKYSENGELDQTYDYTLHKKIFQRDKNEQYPVFLNGHIESSDLDSPPSYAGSKIGLTDEMNKIVEYPLEARRKSVEGDVTISLWIDENGKLGEVELVKGIMKECDNELIKKLKKIPANWIPGTLAGKNVKSKVTYTFKYSMAYVFEEMAVTVL